MIPTRVGATAKEILSPNAFFPSNGVGTSFLIDMRRIESRETNVQ